MLVLFTLLRIHLQYSSGQCSHDYYKETVSRVTSTFQALSQEMLQLMKIFRAEGLSDIVEILQRVQSSEKEKLQLIVKSNILVHSAGEEEETYQVKKWLVLIKKIKDVSLPRKTRTDHT